VKVTLEELEAIRLVDFLDLQQQEAALYVGVSRKALWNDLRSGRKKVASALIFGLGIVIEGGSYLLREEGSESLPSSEERPPVEDQIRLLELEMIALEERLRLMRARMEALEGKVG